MKASFLSLLFLLSSFCFASEYKKIEFSMDCEENQTSHFNTLFIFKMPRFKSFDNSGWFFRAEEQHFFSDAVPFDKICYYLKAGPVIKIEYDSLSSDKFWGFFLPKLTYFRNNQLIVEIATTSSYIKNIYCSPPSRELAFEFLINELRKSQGGSAVDFKFIKKMNLIYPDLISEKLWSKFLRAELMHRYNGSSEFQSRHYQADFVKFILEKYPSLTNEVGYY